MGKTRLVNYTDRCRPFKEKEKYKAKQIIIQALSFFPS